MAEPFSSDDAILIVDCAQSLPEYKERTKQVQPAQSDKPINSVDWKKVGIVAAAGVGMALIYAVTRSKKAAATAGSVIYRSTNNHFYRVAARQLPQATTNQSISNALSLAVPIFTGIHTGPRGGKYRIVNGKKRYDIP